MNKWESLAMVGCVLAFAAIIIVGILAEAGAFK